MFNSFFFLLIVISTSVWDGTLEQEIEPIDECDDVPPPGAPFPCSAYVELGICDEIEEDYCRLSCNKCCEDISFPGVQDCSIIVQLGNCNSDFIKGKYCDISCGFCGKNQLTQDTVEAPSTDQTLPASTELVNTTQAIQKFRLSMNEEAQKRLNSWIEFDSCERWVGITCQNENIINIDLNGVSSLPETEGTIPPEFSVFSQLKILNLSDAYLIGTLPYELSVLSNLQYIILDGNDLSGSLPMEYSAFSVLKKFNFRGNFLQGTLPAQYSALKNVTEIDGNNNEFSGSLPVEYSALDNISYFNFGENSIIGSLPAQYSALTTLDFFGFDENQLTGSLPVEYSTLIFLRGIRLSDNFLTGSLPLQYSTFGQAVDLSNMLFSFLYVDENFLTGGIPNQYSSFTVKYNDQRNKK